MQNPIFILGSHKSGSSLIRSMLDNHPELFVIPTESHYFQYTGHWVDYRLRYASPKDMDKQSLIESLIQLVERKNNHSDPYGDSVINGKFNVAKFKAFLEESCFESPQELFENYVKGLHLSLTGEYLPEHINPVEKSVEHAEFAVFLQQMFPACRFIHIVRNPYASLVAIRKSKTKKNYPLVSDFVLSLQNSYYNLYKNQRLLSNYLVVTYEDLLTHTEKTMQTIANFLDIKFVDSLLTPTLMGGSWNGNSSSGVGFTKISSAPLEKWKSQINDLEIRLVNSFLQPVLEKFGYEQLKPKKSKFYPITGEGLETYLKNRSLLWLEPIPSRSP
ncbi:MAG: sulfotransferase [Mastigocoleus sp.]